MTSFSTICIKCLLFLVVLGVCLAFASDFKAVHPVSLNSDGHDHGSGAVGLLNENHLKYKEQDLGVCFGNDTEWIDHPYVVALRGENGDSCCSGAIVSLNPGVIVTAAHCIRCGGGFAIVGCNDPLHCNDDGNGDQYPITHFIQHPDYESPLLFSNDIAVVRTATAITTPGATAIIIPSVEPSIGIVQVTGYGNTQDHSVPELLQTAEENIIERQECADIMISLFGVGTWIDNTMICIRGGEQAEDHVPAVCLRDSGGPWVENGRLFGTTSWYVAGDGPGCEICQCCPGYPQVGANIALFYDWIHGYMQAWKADEE